MRLALALILFPALSSAQSLTVLDVPFIGQSELLCGGAAAAMVMRYWGERGIDAEAFEPLVDRKAGGIRTDALAADLRGRRWNAVALNDSSETLIRELQQGRPVIALIEDRPGIFHYVVVVARSDTGVVFHDPARTPFRVASVADFDRRWAASDRWMLLVTPGRAAVERPAAVRGQPASTPCDAQIAAGVEQAQRNDLDAAERTFASALDCPGGAALRELAGLRAVQRRWGEAADLAEAALTRGPSDAYVSRLLGTARFVTDDKVGALDAWNRVDEPRIDLIRIDGLIRTRYAIAERALGLTTGETLTRDNLLRARRRLADLPATPGAVDFAPLTGGLAEVRASVAERPLVPHGWFDLGVLGLATAITREVAASIASPTGGGEQIAADWRFWAHRPLYSVSIAAPAPWRGVWTVGVSRERQPYSAVFAPTVRDAFQLDVADWASGNIRWQVGAGVDRWNRGRSYGSVGGGLRFVTSGDRVDGAVRFRSWFGGDSGFRRAEVRVVARSSARLDGIVVVADGGVAAVTSATPPDLWLAGDTGRARPLLLRAHPILGQEERFRTERLARLFTHESTEVQRWWRFGPFRAGAATFVDVGRAARRLTGEPMTDVDLGIGMRGAYPGRKATVRLDVARGLRDGNTAVSAVYTASLP